MENLARFLSTTLKQLRQQRGWSLSRLAEATGVSKAMLGQIERNEYSAAIFLIPICISFDTAEKRRYATYLILNRRFSFEF
ncbi:helix-turn-helix transcriptional regulator [Escherichia coli]|nr:helix-turn-helix transcriptional regulator [Escherichia coli]